MVSLLGRAEQRNSLAFVATVGAKVVFIYGDYYVAWEELAQADQTKIGEIRPSVTVAMCEFAKVFQMSHHIERDQEQSVGNHLEGRFARANMKGSFRENGFAGQSRPTDLLGNFIRPSMVRIASFHQSDKETGVYYGIHFREYPLREERSGGPSLKMPTYLRQA